ncbi:hypothetical protein B0H14DRAFT_2612324 [Mycena olivaceomarginata]|nr:hypothetical protein B0H14DRAFT_2612324 [Mycena olivaceomarginata]
MWAIGGWCLLAACPCWSALFTGRVGDSGSGVRRNRSEDRCTVNFTATITALCGTILPSAPMFSFYILGFFQLKGGRRHPCFHCQHNTPGPRWYGRICHLYREVNHDLNPRRSLWPCCRGIPTAILIMITCPMNSLRWRMVLVVRPEPLSPASTSTSASTLSLIINSMPIHLITAAPAMHYAPPIFPILPWATSAFLPPFVPQQNSNSYPTAAYKGEFVLSSIDTRNAATNFDPQSTQRCRLYKLDVYLSCTRRFCLKSLRCKPV